MRVNHGELAGGLDHHTAPVAGIVEIVELGGGQTPALETAKGSVSQSRSEPDPSSQNR